MFYKKYNLQKTVDILMRFNLKIGNSLVVQWLGLCAFTVKGVGSIPGRGTTILQAVWPKKKKKEKRKDSQYTT